MLAKVISSYLWLSMQPVGLVLVPLVALAVTAAIAWWALRPGDTGRRLLFWVAVAMTVLSSVVYAVVVLSGLWSGTFLVRQPLLLQVVSLLPVQLAGWLAWLLLYRRLSARGWPALAVSVALILVLAEAVALADRADLGGGFFILGPNGTLWQDALLGGLALLVPLVLYEAVRRVLASDLLP